MKSILFIETNKAGSSMEAIKAASDMNYFTILITNNKDLMKDRDSFKDIHEIVYIHEITYENISHYIDYDMDKFYKLVTIISFIEDYILLTSKLRDKYIAFENYSYLETLDSSLGKLESIQNLKKYNMYDDYIYEIIVQDSNILSTLKIKQETSIDNNITTGYLLNKINNEEKKYIKEIVNRLNINFGIYSIKLSNTSISVKPTISGDYTNSLVSFSHNDNYIKQIVNLYLGKKISLKRRKNYIFIRCIIMKNNGYINKVTGKNNSLKHNAIKKIIMTYNKNNNYLKNDIIGYIVASGDNVTEAQKNADSALKKIKISTKEGI